MTDTAVALWTCGLLLLWATCTTALPTGAPTGACSDLTPQHFGTTPSPCGPNCPFSLALTAVDGSPPGNAMQYRCGSLHTSKINIMGLCMSVFMNCVGCNLCNSLSIKRGLECYYSSAYEIL